jgi:sugar lactone lactonase YvrE/uncharacterized protein GlcG (DUF336 family)
MTQVIRFVTTVTFSLALVVPLTATEPMTLDKKSLSLAAARTIIAAAEAEARARNVGVVTVVVDAAGHVIALSRMDQAQVASVNVGIGKARTAAIYRRPSRVFEEQIKNGRVAALALADATPLQGGVPVVIAGEVVGAVGVSGDTPQVDEDIAIAGANAIIKEVTDTSQQPRARSDFGVIERLDPRLDRLIPRDAVLEKVAEGIEWAEGPLWDTAQAALLFSDVPRNGIFRWQPQTGVRRFMDRSGYTGDAPFTGREPGSNGLTFDRQGRLVIAQHGDRRIVRRDANGGLTTIAARFDGKRLNSPNDLVYHSSGDLYFTDPPFGLPKTFDDPAKELPFQGVYRVTPAGEISLLIRDLDAPNGIAFSPDERTLYVSNSSPARPVWLAYTRRQRTTERPAAVCGSSTMGC